VDRFGNFDVVYGPSDNAPANRLTALQFDVNATKSGGGAFTQADFEAPSTGGNGGSLFGLEYFPNTGATGFVDVRAVPEPTSLSLGLTCLAGLGGFAGLRHFRCQRARVLGG
jgi:hypothetical protein